LTSENDYSLVIGRVVRLMAVLGVLGAVVSWSLAGTRGLLGFLGGALLSSLSFWLLHRLVRDLSKGAEGGRVGGPSVLLHAFRFLILAGVAYGILKTYEVSIPAMGAGLLVAVASITLEALYELFYARA
jgi:hypothetical protein